MEDNTENKCITFLVLVAPYHHLNTICSDAYIAFMHFLVTEAAATGVCG